MSCMCIVLHSQVDGPLQCERFSGPAHVFVPKLNGTTARPAGRRATGRHDRHLYRVHDEAESSYRCVSGGGRFETRWIS